MPRRKDTKLQSALGSRFAELRRARGWTQEQLAEAMGIEPVTLSRWETGARALSLAALAQAASALGVTLAEMVDVDHEPPPPREAPDEAELVRLYRSLEAAKQDLALRLVREVARSR